MPLYLKGQCIQVVERTIKYKDKKTGDENSFQQKTAYFVDGETAPIAVKLGKDSTVEKGKTLTVPVRVRQYVDRGGFPRYEFQQVKAEA